MVNARISEWWHEIISMKRQQSVASFHHTSDSGNEFSDFGTRGKARVHERSWMQPFEANLKDGTPVLIRQVQPEDKAAIKTAYSRLSLRSRRLRFLNVPSRLTDGQLRFLTEVDHVNHEALCAIDIGSGSGIGIGIGRYNQTKEKHRTVEFAITVVDEYQGRGLGTILVKSLMRRARANRYQTMIGFILADNEPMLAIVRKLGASLQFDEIGVFRAELSLIGPGVIE